MVPKMVPFHRPSSTGVCCMIWNANPKSHLGLVTSELIIIATSTRMTAIATQRHGCRTGRALITPGRSTVAADGTGDPEPAAGVLIRG